MYRVAWAIGYYFLIFITCGFIYSIQIEFDKSSHSRDQQDLIKYTAIPLHQGIRSRGKRDLSRFQTLADNTGWKAYQRGSTIFSTILDQIILTGTPSQSIISQYTQTITENNTMEIIVGDDITSMDISIQGPTSVTEATLTTPLGVIETFAGTTSSRQQENTTIVMSIQNPSVGTWTLTRNDIDREWKVNITAETGIKMDFQWIQKDAAGIHTILDRNPIDGQLYTLVVIASNINSSYTTSSYSLHDVGGELIETSRLNMSFTPTKNIGFAEVTMPLSPFYVHFEGIDLSGLQFSRISWKQVIPVSVDLIVHPIMGLIGSTENISYKLTNFAAETKEYNVTMSSSVTSPITIIHIATATEAIDDAFEITTTSDIESISYTISVSDNDTSTSQQSVSYTLQFFSTLCTISTTLYECDNMNASCSAYQWSATAVFNFEVSTFVLISGVTVTDHSIDNTRLYISGDCCNVDVSLAAYSVSGNGCQVKLVSGSPATESDGEESQPFLYIIIGGVAAAVVVGLIIVVICKFISTKKANSVKDYSAENNENPFASIHFQHAVPAPVSTTFTKKKFPLLEKDYLKAYNLRPKTAVSRDFSSRPSSGHTSIYLNSRPSSFR